MLQVIDSARPSAIDRLGLPRHGQFDLFDRFFEKIEMLILKIKDLAEGDPENKGLRTGDPDFKGLRGQVVGRTRVRRARSKNFC